MNQSESALLQTGDPFGPYEVIRLLGKGGMGEVYACRHTTLDESFALKLISREILDGAGSLDRFATEARESFRLKHPQIVRVDNYDMVEGQPYLRMELMPGVAVSGGEEAAVSLEDLLMARGGQLSEAEAEGILRDVLGGLAYAHREGVIHRDLKPANILLYEDGAGSIRAKLADFGLVKAIGEDFIQSRIRLSISNTRVVAREVPGNAPKTHSSGTLDSRELSYIGTYDYMAPEQRDGMEATVRSDLYSVGLIAYRMLTGKKVIGMRRLNEMVDGLHPAWDDWVATAADPEPAGRFSSAAEMLQELPITATSNKSQSVGRSAKPAGKVKRPRPERPNKSRPSNAPAIAIPLVVLVLSVVGFFGWQAWQNHRAEQQRIAEEEATLQAVQQHRAEAKQASEAALAEASALVQAQDYPPAIAALSELTDDAFVGSQAQSLLARAEREKADADAAEAERQRLAKLEALREATGILVTVSNEKLQNPDELVFQFEGSEVPSEEGGWRKYQVMKLTPGNYQISIDHPKYRLHRSTVTVRQGETLEIPVLLEPKTAQLKIELSYEENPKGDVRVRLHSNGKEIALLKQGSSTVNLPAETELHLEILADGYLTKSKVLKLPSEGIETWTITLEADSEGWLQRLHQLIGKRDIVGLESHLRKIPRGIAPSDITEAAWADRRAFLEGYYGAIGISGSPNLKIIRPLVDEVVRPGEKISQSIDAAGYYGVVGIQPGAYHESLVIKTNLILIGLDESRRVRIISASADPIRVTRGSPLICGVYTDYLGKSGYAGMNFTGGSPKVVACRSRSKSLSGFYSDVGARASVAYCRSQGSEEAGFIAHDGGIMKVRNSTASGSRYGFCANKDGSILDAKECLADGSRIGFIAMNGGKLEGTECVSKRNKNGFISNGDRSIMRVTGCYASDNKNVGFGAFESGTLTGLKNVASSNNIGFAAMNKAGLEASDCVSEKNKFYGFVSERSKMTVLRVTAKNNGHDDFKGPITRR